MRRCVKQKGLAGVGEETMFKAVLAVITFIAYFFGLVFMYDLMKPESFIDYVLFLIPACVLLFAACAIAGVYLGIYNIIESISGKIELSFSFNKDDE